MIDDEANGESSVDHRFFIHQASLFHTVLLDKELEPTEVNLEPASTGWRLHERMNHAAPAL